MNRTVPHLMGRCRRLLQFSPSDAVASIRFLARVTVTCLACMVMASIVASLFGWHSYVVLSGSMSPSLRVGDVVIAAPADRDDLTPGRIIAFREPRDARRTIVHRIQQVRPDGTLITRGDRNGVSDSSPVKPAEVLGIPRLRIPFIALPAYWWTIHAWPQIVSTIIMLLAFVTAGWPRVIRRASA